MVHLQTDHRSNLTFLTQPITILKLFQNHKQSQESVGLISQVQWSLRWLGPSPEVTYHALQISTAVEQSSHMIPSPIKLWVVTLECRVVIWRLEQNAAVFHRAFLSFKHSGRGYLKVSDKAFSESRTLIQSSEVSYLTIPPHLKRARPESKIISPSPLKVWHWS